MEYNYAYSLEKDNKGNFISIDYYERVKKRKSYENGKLLKNVKIYEGDCIICMNYDKISMRDHVLYVRTINEKSVSYDNILFGVRNNTILFDFFASFVASKGFKHISNPLQFLECFVRRGNLMGFPPPKGIITKEVSDDHEFIIVKPKPHRGGIPFGVKPTPEQLERIFRKEHARQKALEEKEKKKPTMADILIGNIRALRNYAQKVYEAHRDGEYTISDTQKAEIDKQLEKKDKVINKLKKHW